MTAREQVQSSMLKKYANAQWVLNQKIIIFRLKWTNYDVYNSKTECGVARLARLARFAEISALLLNATKINFAIT